ncbi:hypothetical protein RHS02_01594, partial [Rhizoctonia solani]
MECTPMKIHYHQGSIFSASHLDVVIPPTALGGAESVLTSSYGVLVSTSLSYTGGQGIKQAIFADFYLRFPTFLRAQASVASGYIVHVRLPQGTQVQSTDVVWQDHPSTIGTLVADPKYGEPGVLIRQTKQEILHHSNQFRFEEITEVYLKKIRWEEVQAGGFTNSTTSDIKHTFSYSYTATRSKTDQASFNASIGIPGVLDLDIGGGHTTITTDSKSSTRSESKEFTIKPGNTQYHYVKVYTLNVRKWWLGETDGKPRRVITQDASLNSTYSVTKEEEIYQDYRVSHVPFAGTERLQVEPIKKQYDDEPGRGYERVTHRDSIWEGPGSSTTRRDTLVDGYNRAYVPLMHCSSCMH